MSSSEQRDGATEATSAAETSPQPAQPPMVVVAPAQGTAATSTCTDAATSTVPSSGSQRALATPAKSSSSLAEFQEHLSLLREGLVATEDTLESVPPDEYRQLKMALLQVSNMISQMEAVADSLSEKRSNLRNELRTLQDENANLQGALAHERRKFQGRGRGGPVLHGGTCIPLPPPLPPLPPPPLLPRRDSLAHFSPMRAVFCPPLLTKYRPLNDNESSVIDLTSDSIAGSASSSRSVASVGSGPGPSATARRGRGFSRNWRGGSNTTGTMTGLRRTGNASRRSRGSANRSRVRRPPRAPTNSGENNNGSGTPAPVTPASALSESNLRPPQDSAPSGTPAPLEQQPPADPNSVNLYN